MFKKLLSVIMAMVLMLAMAVPASAYELFPGGGYDNAAIGDDEIQACFGINTGEGIYYNRFRILDELERNWGQAFGTWSTSSLNFVSIGLCNAYGKANADVQFLWGRNWTCSITAPILWGQAAHYKASGAPATGFDDWNWSVVEVNADCEIAGRIDWTLSGGIDADKISGLRITTHEFGHSLGLQHSTAAWSLMRDGSANHPCGTWGKHVRMVTDDLDAVIDEYNDDYNLWIGGVPLPEYVCWE
jgi:hypothetical protein